MSGKDEEIRRAVAELEALMKDLRSTVEALSGALFKAHLQQLFAPRNCAHVNPDSP